MSYTRATAVALGLCLVAGWPAGAAEPSAAGRPVVTVHAYTDENGSTPTPSDEATATAVEDAVGVALGGDARVRFVAARDLLDDPHAVAQALGRADLQVEDAEQAFSSMELERARQLLEQAIEVYRAHLPALAARGNGTEPLRDAWLKLAKTRFFDGNTDGAKDALRYAFVLDPSVGWSKSLFPPTMKKTFVESKLLYETLGTGKLSIESDPPGATVWLNGHKLEKPTPLTVDADPGPNYLTFDRREFRPTTVVVENQGGDQTSSASQTLQRWPKNPFAGLDRDRAQLDRLDAPPHLRESAHLLGADLLLLVRVQRTTDDATRRVSAYLYDARPDRILKRAERLAPADDVKGAAEALAAEVTSGVRLDGTWLPAVAARGPSGWARFSTRTKTDLKRFYHWKGFWYVVGGVAGAAVVSAAVGGGVAAHNHQLAVDSVLLLGGH